MKKLLFVVVIGMLSACSNPIEDLKSPCVGIEGAPCERRAPDSQWLG